MTRNILLVDDHAHFRESAAWLLESLPLDRDSGAPAAQSIDPQERVAEGAQCPGWLERGRSDYDTQDLTRQDVFLAPACAGCGVTRWVGGGVDTAASEEVETNHGESLRFLARVGGVPPEARRGHSDVWVKGVQSRLGPQTGNAPNLVAKSGSAVGWPRV